MSLREDPSSQGAERMGHPARMGRPAHIIKCERSGDRSMWIPEITANGVLAFATLVYGAATTALVISTHRDRQQRHDHFQKEQKDKKLEILYSAFCDAWGYSFGLSQRSYDAPVTATDAAKVTEAMIR